MPILDSFPFLRSIAHLLLCFLSISTLKGQIFPPPVGQQGSTAIPKDSSIMVAWATGCTLTRGLQDISNTDLGYATVGADTSALGMATGTSIVSLGDGGEAILTFAQPITNGNGWDFAVFENGFGDLFLELAFVEVSSDGVNYVRFPATSLVQDTEPIGSFGLTDATKINNFAGKYRGGYGTPFDLEELANAPLLDITAITHVKIMDVVGSILPQYARYDQYGTAIQDPWPTPFPSSGFDLDAVGVIHQKTSNAQEALAILANLAVYPNPVAEVLHLAWPDGQPALGEVQVDLMDVMGVSVWSEVEALLDRKKGWYINVKRLSPGGYFLVFRAGGRSLTHRVVVGG